MVRTFEDLDYSLAVKTEPSGEPITTAEAKEQVHVKHSDEDTYIDSLIVAARRHIEGRAGWQYLRATRYLYLDQFPTGREIIRVPRPPLISIVSIQYVDTDGDTQTWASSLYDTDFDATPGRIRPAFGEVYPPTRQEMKAVTIEYTNGYTNAAAVPDNWLHALKFLVSHWYRIREPVTDGSMPRRVPETLDALIDLEAMPAFGV